LRLLPDGEGVSVDLFIRFIANDLALAIRPPTGWLDGTNLTWFDVPGECNRIWNGGADDSSCMGCAAACTDTDQMAGCILGGGTAVNAGLWWNVSDFPSNVEDGD
jgi:cellobiose dehydrogenase (acceptor)